MYLFTITNHDNELIGVYESDSHPDYIEPEITKIHKEWTDLYLNDEIDERIESYFEKHLPNIGVYPVEIGNVTIIDR
jgi:hypothetical protein